MFSEDTQTDEKFNLKISKGHLDKNTMTIIEKQKIITGDGITLSRSYNENFLCCGFHC